MKKLKFTTLGILIGAAATLSITALADYIVVPNSFPVKVNGQTVQVEGYNINDSTYFKLRDVADAVGGFEVGFKDNTIIINTPNKPTPSPVPTPATHSASDITIVKGEDGNDYTSDGLRIKHTSEGDYVVKEDILFKVMASQGISGYDFAGKYFYKKGSKENILDNIPLHPEHNLLIPVEYYISTIQPLIQTLKAE
ncbi:MAG: hypothetical protein HFE50_07865 [Clostridia bacterium]|nr:hypothetical protein [Clostridia bacterium]